MIETGTTEVIINDNIMVTDKPAYLCVIMPAYNEGEHIKDNLLKASNIISTFIKNYQILAINDGSTDNTKEMITQAASEDSHISYVSYPSNQGKGYAIAKGVHFADAEYISFLDSDLELNPVMLRYFLSTLLATDADIAIGSKLHKNSKLKYPLVRRILSLGYFIILKIMFKLSLKDTQTGIKLFKADIIKLICKDLATTSFAFDIEILATASAMGCKIIEMPIELNYSREKKSHRIKLSLLWNIFKDTIKIKQQLKIKQKNMVKK